MNTLSRSASYWRVFQATLLLLALMVSVSSFAEDEVIGPEPFFYETEPAPTPVPLRINDFRAALEIELTRPEASTLRFDYAIDHAPRIASQVSKKNRSLLGIGVSAIGGDVRYSNIGVLRNNSTSQVNLRTFADLGLKASDDEEAHLELLARIGAMLEYDLHNNQSWSLNAYGGGAIEADILHPRLGLGILLGVGGTFGGDRQLKRDLAAESADANDEFTAAATPVE